MRAAQLMQGEALRGHASGGLCLSSAVRRRAGCKREAEKAGGVFNPRLPALGKDNWGHSRRRAQATRQPE